MTSEQERMCLVSLNKICCDHFDKDEFSLNGKKESAVCLDKVQGKWNVYESEKNSYNDLLLFDNIVEAALDFLRRLSAASEYGNIKDKFLASIIAQKKA